MALLFLFRFLFQSCCLFLEANPLPVVAAEGEESCGRFYCLVKSMRNGDWLPIGPGDLLLAKDVTTSKARVVFFQKEDLLKARINCWLHPLALAERNTFVNLNQFHCFSQATQKKNKKKKQQFLKKCRAAPKTVIMVLPVTKDQTATYSVQLKTVEEADTLHGMINQVTHVVLLLF